MLKSEGVGKYTTYNLYGSRKVAGTEESLSTIINSGLFIYGFYIPKTH
jgi:hypothetical protein